MGESNGDWGDLAAHDAEMAAAWDRCERLPEPGENPALDAFCERKGLTIPALVRIGARLADPQVLAFAYRGALKYRDMVTDRRWSWLGSDFSNALKVVRHSATPSKQVLIVEGETDGARCADVYACDVAIMPAGAEFFPASYAETLDGYEIVLIGLDRDAAGERGAERIKRYLPGAVRFPPPANDWCEAESFPPLPTEPPGPATQDALLVSARDLLELEPPEVVSWFEQAILPVGGLAIIHGWAKSYKTFTALDMLAALAQGQDWACFEPTEEACKVAVIQYEIPWPFYQQRVRQLRQHAREPQLFDSNFLTWQPLRRPELVAGNKTQEDFVLRALVKAGVQVVLIDPIRRATGTADINAENEVRKVLRFFERIQDEGITVVSVHHDNKAYAGRGDVRGMTGSGAFAGDPDTLISIEVPRGEDHRTSPRRNLLFTLRNAPSVGPRSMEMQEDGRIVYDTTPFGIDDETDRPDEPDI